jgi:hypothetical protein
MLFCNYTPGLPASTSIQWNLNPTGSVAKLRDAAGTNLPDGCFGNFETSATSNLGIPDVKWFQIGKERRFWQDGATPVNVDRYSVDYPVDLNGISTVSSVDFSFPGGGVDMDSGGFNNRHIGNDHTRLISAGGKEGEGNRFAEKADMDRIFPNGAYQFTLHTFHDGDKSVTLTLAPDSYPNAPTVQNFAATQALDGNLPFILQWGPMAGGTSDDFISVNVEGGFSCLFETPGLEEPGALDGTATSVTIPADSLPPGRTLEGELFFAKIIDNDPMSYPGARGFTSFGTITRFEIRTTGDPFQPQLDISNDGMLAKVTVIGERGRQYELCGSEDLQNWNPVWTQSLFGDCGGGFLSSFEYFENMDVFPKRFYRVKEVPLESVNCQ